MESVLLSWFFLGYVFKPPPPPPAKGVGMAIYKDWWESFTGNLDHKKGRQSWSCMWSNVIRERDRGELEREKEEIMIY